MQNNVVNSTITGSKILLMFTNDDMFHHGTLNNAENLYGRQGQCILEVLQGVNRSAL